MDLSNILRGIRKNEREEINPASVVREFLILNGMIVSDVCFDDMQLARCYAKLPSGDLVQIMSLRDRPAVRISAAIAHKIPVRHFRSGRVHWMARDEHIDFDLVEPDSLQRIVEFLNPRK